MFARQGGAQGGARARQGGAQGGAHARQGGVLLATRKTYFCCQYCLLLQKTKVQVLCVHFLRACSSYYPI